MLYRALGVIQGQARTDLRGCVGLGSLARRPALSCRSRVIVGSLTCSSSLFKGNLGLTRSQMLIQKLRLQRGWSQEQLAELSGLSVRTIQRLERGETASVESLKSLGAVFEIDFSD